MGIDFIVPDWPAPASVKAVVTTRLGGVSQEPFESLNPAFHVGDDAKNVARNRQLISNELTANFEPQWLEQVHGIDVVEARIDHADIGPLVNKQEGIVKAICQLGVPCADAIITSDLGLPCAVMTADCLPVLFCNVEGDQVGVAHAGWRGLAAGVLENTFASFDQPPERMLVWLGPAIGPDNFEVGEEVRDTFLSFSARTEAAFQPNKSKPGHWFADLYLLAKIRLNRLGIESIYGGDFCTYADSARFYSYRRDHDTGRMASIIWIE